MALLLAAALPLAASAQAPADGGGAGPRWRRGGQVPRLFDPTTVTTVEGEVLEIQRLPGGRRGEGIHLTLATGNEKLAVRVGPSSFVDQQDLKLAKGDQVAVKGSRITPEGEPTVIAQEVTRGGETMVLRDASGFPMWAGARGRRR